MGNKTKRHKKKRKETKDTCTESRGIGLEPVGVKISEASGIDAANMPAENVGLPTDHSRAHVIAIADAVCHISNYEPFFPYCTA